MRMASSSESSRGATSGAGLETVAGGGIGGKGTLGRGGGSAKSRCLSSDTSHRNRPTGVQPHNSSNKSAADRVPGRNGRLPIDSPPARWSFWGAHYPHPLSVIGRFGLATFFRFVG